MKKITLSIALVAIIGLQAYSQDVKQVTSLPFNAGKTFSAPSKNHPIKLQARGGAPAITVAYSDDFNALNDTDNLKLRGYIPYYRGSGPQGTTATWYQGAGATAGTFDAYNGAPTDYVAANYNVVTGANNIDSWLVLPALNIIAGDIMTFYSRAPLASTFPDSIRVMYSAVGDSTPEDLSWIQLGNFVVNTLGMWELQSFTAPAAGTTARFAIRYNVVDGGINGTNSDYIGIDQIDVFTPSAVDGGVSLIDPIASGCGLSATTPITVTISNFGMGAITGFPVSYTINAGAPVTETFTGSIAPAATATYTFTATADLSVPGAYTIAASTAIPLDGNATNDGVSISTTNSAANNLALGLPMGFEPGEDLSEWSVEDINADGVTWDIVTLATTYFHSGTQCVRKAGSGGGALPEDDDWLFTPCLDLVAGTTYSVDYWWKNFDFSPPCLFEVSVGTGANGASMTQSIIQHPVPPDTSYQHGTPTFTVPSSGVYYIGFHAYMIPGTGGSSSLRLDDINISIVTGISEVDHVNDLQISPNPTNGILNITGKMIDKNSELVITNTIGQTVYIAKYNDPFKTQVDLSGFASGIYTVQLITSKVTITKKIVVEK
ncbi:MAG: choice-of-anchor J domain-containing protein [Bacteroidia bacterium]